MLPAVYSVEHCIHHYRSMAKTNFRGFLQQEMVPLKKYFYVLRPLLSVRWPERYGVPAPIEFARLLAMIEADRPLVRAIDDLLAKKRVSPELGLSPQVPPIQDFIVRELARLEQVVPERTERASAEPVLSALFRSVLDETWKSG